MCWVPASPPFATETGGGIVLSPFSITILLIDLVALLEGIDPRYLVGESDDLMAGVEEGGIGKSLGPLSIGWKSRLGGLLHPFLFAFFLIAFNTPLTVLNLFCLLGILEETAPPVSPALSFLRWCFGDRIFIA